MGLNVPLRAEQIVAAEKIRSTLHQWKLADATLQKLRSDHPGFASEEVCVLKSVAVNSLYGTQVYAIVSLAQKIREKHEALVEPQSEFEAWRTVHEIANLETPGKKIVRTSFAAKFCHFFISEHMFHIYDQAAKSTLEYHLGSDYSEKDVGFPYSDFCRNVSRLRDLSQATNDGKRLDQYLWLTGLCEKWSAHYSALGDERVKKSAPINAEARSLFESPDENQSAQLEKMLPFEIYNRYVSAHNNYVTLQGTKKLTS